jgi:acetoin utilization deacetylase AcuC-like enzyme
MIPVFFTPKMVAESGCESPSAAKPPKVVQSWLAKFPIAVILPTPVTVDELCAAHDRTFVEDILACKRPNGFGNTSKDVAESLPFTSGAMLSAARHALEYGGAAAAPCSGFHHAEWDKCMGFCTFNGLMVTALALHASGTECVGILDLDMHYGNGTDNIIQKKGLNSHDILHFTGGRKYTRPEQAKEFFEYLPRVLDDMMGCGADIVLYQAGADPHVDDPYGGWLTTEQLRQRDAIVFETLHKAKVPIAWNLAGGYQRDADGGISKVLEIHDNTMRECVRVYEGVKP